MTCAPPCIMYIIFTDFLLMA